MAINIIESVQKSLGIEALQKADPNTQEPVPNGDLISPAHSLMQAAIPAVLAAIYEKTRNVETTTELLDAPVGTNYLPLLFVDNVDAASEEVAAYSNTYATKARLAMEQVAENAIKVIKQEAHTTSAEDVSDFISGQRNNILQYLPASLRMGHLLGDNTLDDATNKMEGPVSGLMHSLETLFSGSK